jgi:hypothetical protein
MTPPASVLVWAFLALGWLAWRTSETQYSLGFLTTAVLGTQVGLHLTYAISAAAPSSMHMQGMPDTASLMPATGSQLQLLPGGWPMLAGHVACAAVLVTWLRGGERLLWRALGAAASTVARVIARVTRRPDAPSADTDRRCPLLPSGTIASSSHRLIAHSLRRRGPPALAS